jgi:peptidoglycan/LPS O-acetylase OafA/YrhL
MGYYPLFALVQLLFGAMFVYADNLYNGPLATAFHALLTFSLTQAWFPAHAELWNAPTWFLSALTFAMVVLPHALPPIAALRKRGLRALLLGLGAVSLLSKLAYTYDLPGALTFLEGVMSPRAHPNLLLWNVTRFNPFYCTLEVLMGVAAARLVMLDGVDDEGKPLASPPPHPGSALLPAAGLVGITLARAAGWVALNDPLTRGLVFIPLFTLLVMRLHRHTAAAAAGAKPAGLAGWLAHPALTYLGAISFPIFVVHQPIGQLFFKKVIATKLFGGVLPPSFFPAFLAIVLASAVALHHLFIENKKVRELSAAATKQLSAALA